MALALGSGGDRQVVRHRPPVRETADFRCGSKLLSDAVSAVNAPRRTAEYNGKLFRPIYGPPYNAVPKAWQIMLDADHPRQIASNAFLKLCRLDASAETEKWARTAPRFSADGRVAVITIHSGFQSEPLRMSGAVLH